MTKKQRQNKEGQGLGVADRKKVEPPKKYKVILHNDDYTPMNFVVAVLQQVFHKSESAATAIMMSVHTSGKGIAGVYQKSIAEMKVAECRQYATAHEHPFLVQMEKE